MNVGQAGAVLILHWKSWDAGGDLRLCEILQESKNDKLGVYFTMIFCGMI